MGQIKLTFLMLNQMLVETSLWFHQPGVFGVCRLKAA